MTSRDDSSANNMTRARTQWKRENNNGAKISANFQSFCICSICIAFGSLERAKLCEIKFSLICSALRIIHRLTTIAHRHLNYKNKWIILWTEETNLANIFPINSCFSHSPIPICLYYSRSRVTELFLELDFSYLRH